MVSFLRQVVTCSIIFGAFVLNESLASSESQDICVHGLPESVPCFNTQNSWDLFRLSLTSAVDGMMIKYCPFLITDVNLPAAAPKAKVTFACAVRGACVIQGPGRHLVFQGQDVETLFYGFVFQNATNSSIRVFSNATKTQTFCRVYFERNTATIGGAIRTSPKTRVVLKKAYFHKNSAVVAGAILNLGKMVILNSRFNRNLAEKEGGAVVINASSAVLVANSVFLRNSAMDASHMYYSGPNKTNFVAAIFNDQGGNRVVGGDCPGILVDTMNSTKSSKCIHFKSSPGPTAPPSKAASDFPSLAPSTRSHIPTITASPTVLSASPTAITNSATSLPTISTAAPTFGPSQTLSLAPSQLVSYMPPLDPENNTLPLVNRTQPTGYFNYNMDDPDFGPTAWGNVDVTNNPYSMYADLAWDTSVNECGNGGFQSPIDLFITTALCLERHQIRGHSGNWKRLTEGGDIVFEVTPDRLRVQFFGNGTDNQYVDAAHGYDPMAASHIEVTIPSLHTFNGKRFDAEYTVFSVYTKLHEVLIVSVVIDASENAFNDHFEKLLTAWGQVPTCGIGNGRRLDEMDLFVDMKNGLLDEEEVMRRLQQNVTIDGQFNIFDNELFPSIYFYGYRGSLPVPPCTTTSEWRVLDVPMKISWAQLEQLKQILSDGPCKDSPFRVGLNDVLSRPLQPADSMDAVWHCTSQDFQSDCVRFKKFCPAPN